jgi:hypothetical protein
MQLAILGQLDASKHLHIKPLSRVSSLTASVLQLSKLNDVSIRVEAVNLGAVLCRLGLDQTDCTALHLTRPNDCQK